MRSCPPLSLAVAAVCASLLPTSDFLCAQNPAPVPATPAVRISTVVGMPLVPGQLQPAAGIKVAPESVPGEVVQDPAAAEKGAELAR